MHPALNRNLYLVKEHVGFFKAANNYDIFDPATGEMILECREPHLGPLTKILRFTDFKRNTPFDIHVTTPEGEQVVRIQRGVCLFLSKVDVMDEDDDRVGGFKQKLFSIGGAFQVLGENDEPMCDLNGSWTGWNFKFTHAGEELAEVTKKWTGLGKELFTSADNYVVKISDIVPPDNPIRILIMGAVFCIDMVLKEHRK
ncbi:phospholipid scramblase-related protein [Planctomicrobium sp. SH661]|uniref:phospholipid scramblase-related protein n=1 Tax=Planctomicrobium sp. SH661 TaxID=3448124 RepID=UPI003F5B7A49